MKRIILAAFAMIAVLGLLGDHRQHKLQATFDSVALGTYPPELVGRLGTPWKIAGCGQSFGGDSVLGCANEVLYASPFAPVSPEYWGFQFSSDDRLIGKYRYISP